MVNAQDSLNSWPVNVQSLGEEGGRPERSVQDRRKAKLGGGTPIFAFLVEATRKPSKIPGDRTGLPYLVAWVVALFLLVELDIQLHTYRVTEKHF